MHEALTYDDLVPNAVLGHYTLVEHVTDGGMGHVFRAFEPSLQRDVAIKVLKAEFARDPEVLMQFEMEAQNIAALRHPNIVPVYYVGKQGELYFFVMPFIVGQTLDHWLDTGESMNYEEAKWIIYQAADALERALSQNIIHLDIKPSNFLMDESGVILLTDFGLAKVLGQNVDADSEDSFCTPAYMCPEQILRKSTDQRSDIYCLGATMFHLITGQFLFDTDTITELVKAHLRFPFPHERAMSLGLTPGWIHLLSKMVEKEPENRYQNYQDLRAAVDNVEQLTPVHFTTDSDTEEIPSGPVHVPVQKPSPKTLHGLIGRKNIQWVEGTVEKGLTKPKEEIFSQITREPKLKIDELVPALKELSTHVSTDMGDLAEAVSLIPEVDDYILQLSASKLIIGDKIIKTKRQALRQLGMNLSGQILLAAVMIQNVTKNEDDFMWRSYWQQSVATGIVAHILLRILEQSYVPGKGNVPVKKKTGFASFKKTDFEKVEKGLFCAALCHGIGKIVFSEVAAYPFFVALYEAQRESKFLADEEMKIFDCNHYEVGAEWLKIKGFDAGICDTAQHYNAPEQEQGICSALICVASHVVRLFGIGYGGDPVISVRDVWNTSVWTYLSSHSQSTNLAPDYMDQEFIPLVSTLPEFEV